MDKQQQENFSKHLPPPFNTELCFAQLSSIHVDMSPLSIAQKSDFSQLLSLCGLLYSTKPQTFFERDDITHLFLFSSYYSNALWKLYHAEILYNDYAQVVLSASWENADPLAEIIILLSRHDLHIKLPEHLMLSQERNWEALLKSLQLLMCEQILTPAMAQLFLSQTVIASPKLAQSFKYLCLVNINMTHVWEIGDIDANKAALYSHSLGLLASIAPFEERELWEWARNPDIDARALLQSVQLLKDLQIYSFQRLKILYQAMKEDPENYEPWLKSFKLLIASDAAIDKFFQPIVSLKDLGYVFIFSVLLLIKNNLLEYVGINDLIQNKVCLKEMCAALEILHKKGALKTKTLAQLLTLRPGDNWQNIAQSLVFYHKEMPKISFTNITKDTPQALRILKDHHDLSQESASWIISLNHSQTELARIWVICQRAYITLNEKHRHQILESNLDALAQCLELAYQHRCLEPHFSVETLLGVGPGNAHNFLKKVIESKKFLPIEVYPVMRNISAQAYHVLSMRNKLGQMPLLFAAEHGNPSIIDTLSHPSINITDNKGRTALIIASENNHYLVANKLLAQKTDINTLCSKDWNAAYCAIKHGEIRLIQRLYNSSVDFTISNKYGKTLWMIATENDRTDICDYLIHHGVTEGLQRLDYDGKSIEYYASGNLNTWMKIISSILRKENITIDKILETAIAAVQIGPMTTFYKGSSAIAFSVSLPLKPVAEESQLAQPKEDVPPLILSEKNAISHSSRVHFPYQTSQFELEINKN